MQNPLGTPMPWDLVAEGYEAEVVPIFTAFAREALRLAAANGRILDVACGPGTLTLLAAENAPRVDAVDFSPAMVERLSRRAPANVFAQVADGQNLPFPDGTFDAAFSMFGLIFFPDRARGLSELHRVLRPGGRVAISSWPPADRVPLMQVMFGAMREQGMALPEGRPALGEPADYEVELGAAGFRDVRVKQVVGIQTAPTLDALWASLERSLAPLVLMRKMLGDDRYGALARAIRGKLADRFGTGPQRVELPAWIGTATA